MLCATSTATWEMAGRLGSGFGFVGVFGNLRPELGDDAGAGFVEGAEAREIFLDASGGV